MIALTLMQKIITLFAIMAAGFVLVKIKLVASKDSKILSLLVLYLIGPCVLLSAFQVDATPEIKKGLLITIVASALVNVAFMAVFYIMRRLFHMPVIEAASAMYPNASNLVIPLVLAVFGKEWVIYTTGYNFIQSILLWTHCRLVISEEKHIDFKKLVGNINIVAIVIGIILFFFGIKIPAIVLEPMDSIGGMIGPSTMLIMGMLMADMNFKEIFVRKRVWLIATLRLIVLPLIAMAVIKLCRFESMVENGRIIMLIMFLSCIAPPANTVTQMAQVYDKDAKYANAINVLSVLLCVATMPLMFALFEIL